MAIRRDVIRTKAAICQAYLDLLFLKHKDKITVRDILERANFSHGTFYAHYHDIEDLQNQVYQMVVSNCLRAIDQSDGARPEPFLATLEPRREELRALDASGNLVWIAEEMKRVIISAMQQSIHSAQVSETICRCIAGTLVDATLGWLLGKDDTDRETFLCTITTFIDGGTMAAVTGAAK